MPKGAADDLQGKANRAAQQLGQAPSRSSYGPSANYGYGVRDGEQLSWSSDRGNSAEVQQRAEKNFDKAATRTLALQADQAQAQVAVQQQTLARLRNGSIPQEISQARIRMVSAEADALRAEQDLARLQGIEQSTQGRGVSAQDLDRASSTLQIARAKVTEQRDALRLAELGPRVEEVAAAEAQLKAAQAQLALLQHQIAQGALKAPADAIVRSRLLEPGDMATPQRPVFALALTQPKWVRIYVSEPDLGKIQPGMAAKVSTDSQPEQTIAGKVGYIASVAEFTPKSVQTTELRTSLVYEVRVLVDDPDDRLRLGQPATVALGKDAAK